MEKSPKPERPKDSNGEDSLEGVTAESLGNAPMMMTVDEIATCLGISSRTVWRLKAKGDLPKSLKIGRAVRWKKSDILAWIEKGCPASESILNNIIYAFILRPIYKLIGRL
jgi:excisionase family DNA binding protein